MKKKSLMELQIGITDLCNYSCIMCMQNFHKGIYGKEEDSIDVLHDQKKGFMSISLFRKTLDDLSELDFSFKYIALHWLGESIMHPQFDEFFEILASYNEKRELCRNIIIFTNCYYLDFERNSRLVDIMQKYTGFNFIFVFSLDSASSFSYKQIRQNNNFHKIMDNVKDLTEKSLHLNNVYRVYRFLVMKENIDEVIKFKNMWADFLKDDYQVTYNEEKNFDHKISRNILNFKRVYEHDLNRAQELHKQALIKLKINEKNYFSGSAENNDVCAAPFRTPIINWDGKITVCCVDSELELCAGDLNKQKFKDIWFSDTLNQFRKAHQSKNKGKFNRCIRCAGYAGFPLKDKEINMYF